ncbi:unnamed protein product [Effrenium voratum]|nr:unnamed protein product [Effrenium voratum]
MAMACLSPITTAQVESANGRESWLIRGIQPDQQGDCGLFTRLGKKCGATCREGEFGQGQVHCVGGGGGNPNSLQVPSGRFKAETGFDCIPQVSDSMFPAPVITALTPVGDAIRVAATVTRDPNTVRSPIQQLTIRSVSGAMSCSVDRTGMSLSRTQVNDVPDLPDISIRRLSIDSEGFFVPANLSGSAASASSRRLVVADTCGTDFNGVNECMPGQDSGSCSACGPDDVTSDGSCFKAPSGSHNCDITLDAGDFYSCKFSGWGSDSQRCFAAPPANYCVKRVCTYQGGTKSCSAFVPATNAPFCIGDPSLPAIDHAVIMYTCCDHNLLSFTGFCGGPTTPCVVRASGRGVCPTPQTDEYLVGAENLAGTSWSLPKAVTCSSIPTPSEPAKYEIPSSCTALVSGASCEVSCGNGYAKEGSGGTFTCQNGLSESPSGELPNCVALPSGIHVVQAPLASTTTTTTTSLPTRCAVCSTIGDWQDSRYASCRAWGDPHITESWRSNAPQRFDHQGTGVYKWATSNHCGGDFELQTFQCQYRGGRNAVITAVAARLNGGDRVFVSERTVTHSGDPAGVCS